MSGLDCHELVNEWSAAATTRVLAVYIFVRELVHIFLPVYDTPSEEIPLFSSPRRGCQTPIAKMLDAGDSMRRHCHISTEVFAPNLRFVRRPRKLGVDPRFTHSSRDIGGSRCASLLPSRRRYSQLHHIPDRLSTGTAYCWNSVSLQSLSGELPFYYAYVGPASSFLMLPGTTHAPL